MYYRVHANRSDEVKGGPNAKGSPPPPPNNDEEPKHNNEENHVPKPSTALTLRHIVHTAEGSAQESRRLCERVGLLNAKFRPPPPERERDGYARTKLSRPTTEFFASFPIPMDIYPNPNFNPPREVEPCK